MEDTIDSIDHFKINLNVIMRLRGSSNMKFPMTIRTTGLGAQKARLKYDIDLTSIYITSILMWLCLSLLYYLVSPSWMAVLFGLPGALIVWFSMRSSVEKALRLFEKRLSKLNATRIMNGAEESKIL